MNIAKPAPWQLTQHFHIRASTMLLIYMTALVIHRMAGEFLLPLLPASGVSVWLFIFLHGSPMLWIPALIFALAFLLASIIKRNPQVQFMIESALALAFAFHDFHYIA